MLEFRERDGQPLKISREISYQVGRRKGVIRLDEGGRPIPVEQEWSVPHKDAGGPPWIWKHFWKAAPGLTLPSVVLLLYILPILMGCALLWLIMLLLQV